MRPITLADVEMAIRTVPDFPKKGIQFKDITTALKNPEIFRFMADHLVEHYKDKGITKVVGIESRGFILGSILAYRLNAGFVPIRKPGKLPADTYTKAYSLEYGEDRLEIHKDALCENDVVLLHDDLLATGGSACAAMDLIHIFRVKKLMISFIIELSFLEGIKKFPESLEIYSMIKG